jgi:hypothetical protein
MIFSCWIAAVDAFLPLLTLSGYIWPHVGVTWYLATALLAAGSRRAVKVYR